MCKTINMKYLTVLKFMLLFTKVSLDQDLPYNVAKACCNQGQSFASNLSQISCSEVDISDIGLKQKKIINLCRSAAEWCCKEELLIKDECSVGIGMAHLNLCTLATSDTAQQCCLHCLRGERKRKLEGKSACDEHAALGNDRSFFRVNALEKQAAYRCCMNNADETDIDEIIEEIFSIRELPTSTAKSSSISNATQFQPCIALINPSPTIKTSEYTTFDIPLQTVLVPSVNKISSQDYTENGIETEAKEKSKIESYITASEECETSGECVVHSVTPQYDECKRQKLECGPEQQCVKKDGKYSCQCPDGYFQIGPFCEDKDECIDTEICDNGRCVNTVGSYRCECSSGFRNSPNDNDECVDVDECSEELALCDHVCENMFGSYRCTCDSGYKLDYDNRTCVDIDECEATVELPLPDRTCMGFCENTAGSYNCNCPDGYRLGENKRTCLDINECQSGEAACGNNDDDVCLNTHGSYYCHKIECPFGYIRENKQCVRVPRTCQIRDLNCLQQPSTYSYNFITIVAHLDLAGGNVNIFTMRGPTWDSTRIDFDLKLVNVDASPGVENADLACFDLQATKNVCVVSLQCSLEGPHNVELELTMSLHQRGRFFGSAVAKLFVVVSEYDF